MSAFILPCTHCQRSTLHRAAVADSGNEDLQRDRLQCAVCGALRAVPGEGEAEGAARTSAEWLEMLPAMSQKRAHSQLEEILYEHRAAIEESPAFQEVVAAAPAGRFEIQDIKVKKYHREARCLLVDFSFFALSEPDDEPDAREVREVRIAGSGVGSIDAEGNADIRDVTAATMVE